MDIKASINRKFKIARWMLGGKANYLTGEPFLKRPEISVNPELDRSRMDLYEKGLAVIPGFSPSRPIAGFLSEVKNEFHEASQLFEKSLKEGTPFQHVDSKRRQWSINGPEGTLQWVVDDPTHKLYSMVYGPEKIALQQKNNYFTMEELFQQFPVLREVVENPIVEGIAKYANGGNLRPVTIKLERKTLTTGKNYNQIHFDTYSSTLKAYLYLSDVDVKTGAFAYSEGSHHWKMYPQMLYEIMAKREKKFTLEDLRRYGIKPFSYAALPAGSLFCFSGNIIHSATNVTAGERWAIQFYYYTTEHWSTDKANRG